MAVNRSDQPMRRKRDYHIDQKQFCAAWQSSESPEECARKLGMPKPIVIARAAAYRHAGVALKKMTRKPKNLLDVEGLNRFLKEMEAPPAETSDVPDEVTEHIREHVR